MSKKDLKEVGERFATDAFLRPTRLAYAGIAPAATSVLAAWHRRCSAPWLRVLQREPHARVNSTSAQPSGLVRVAVVGRSRPHIACIAVEVTLERLRPRNSADQRLASAVACAFGVISAVPDHRIWYSLYAAEHGRRGGRVVECTALEMRQAG